MNAHISLEQLFKERIFRIPDYQRGYAWQTGQLDAFWGDLINLPESRSHYTGVVTLKEIPKDKIERDSKEFWLVDDHSYKTYHVVDGQQRLTTFVVLLQAFVEFVRQIPENVDQHDSDIYITDSLSLADIVERYLFKIRPRDGQFRTYKFGYAHDNPSEEYLRYCMLGEAGNGFVPETFYTLNLGNAKTYFEEQIKQLYIDEGSEGLRSVYRKVTRNLMINDFIIKDEFDVFVAFETMNNRGKKLSDLELLKNRLIYLTTLYEDAELDEAGRKDLRDTINNAWKEIYFQLGRNKDKPLNDDDFLKAHWTMYFQYSRKKGNDYIRFLLDEQFTPQKVHKKISQKVKLQEIEEHRIDTELADEDIDENEELVTDVQQTLSAALPPGEIKNYVNSLKSSALHWFNTFSPQLASELSAGEKDWVERLNRGGVVYFRPLMMAILKNNFSNEEREIAFQNIERFIFIAMRLTNAKANYRSSEFYNAARSIDSGAMTLAELNQALQDRLKYAFNEEDGSLYCDDLIGMLRKNFARKVGWYRWTGLRYFLYEYELELLAQTRQPKVEWSSLLKSSRDKISIEHIYPQAGEENWAIPFAGYDDKWKTRYCGSLGNFLLLSASINSSLQNDAFEDKRKPKHDRNNERVRNGYADGSHSEIKVSQHESWGPTEIRARGLELLAFMERRWNFKFPQDQCKEQLLHLEADPRLPDNAKEPGNPVDKAA